MSQPQPPPPPHILLPAPFSNTNPPPTLITQGAEGHLLKNTFLSPDQPAALKIRPSKPYRHPLLDQRLTKQRVLAEARVLAKLGGLGDGEGQRGVRVPRLYGVEWRPAHAGNGEEGDEEGKGNGEGAKGGGAWLLMEWIEGRSVRQLLQEWDRGQKRKREMGKVDQEEAQGEGAVKRLLRRIGAAVGKMHSLGGVVHGDLTSSNIMVRPLSASTSDSGLDSGKEGEGNGVDLDLDGEIVLIDFGLASQSIQDEDRAVDLYVLERAFGSTHPRQEGMFKAEVLESMDGYKGSFKGSSVVLKRLEEVRLRGRKRSMVG